MENEKQSPASSSESSLEMTVEFVYQFPWRGKLHELKVPLKLPYWGSIEELSSRIVKSHSIPFHLEEDMTSDLKRFVSRETSKHQDACGDHVILTALQDEEVMSKRVKDLVDRYTENYAEFSNHKEAEEDKFPRVYHSLINSPQLNTLLQVEQTYAIAIRDLLKSKKNALDLLQKRQDEELNKAMGELGVYTSDYDINQLMRRHVQERESREQKWLEEVGSMQETQSKEYKEWLFQLSNEELSQSGRRISGSIPRPALEFVDDDTFQPSMEESFTINLGAQEKSSHNLRLLCGDLLSFCKHADGGNDNLEEPKLKLSPQRIQSAMSLYTTNISAIILMVDQEVSSVMGPKEVFADACRQSTDFHFPSIDAQLHLIRQYAATLNEERLLGLHSEEESRHNLSSSFSSRQGSIGATPERSRDPSIERDLCLYANNASPTDNLLHPHWSSTDPTQRDGLGTRSPSPSSTNEEEGVKLRPGDFYLTRHSNLSQVHVVCHLVSDERAILDPNMRARDSLMQGLRTSLRTLAKHGIRHIMLPLMLTGQMKPDMNISWCLRRAELVFKSIKGFLLESTAWSGSSESWNLQFLIPNGISMDLFEQISELLSKTFRKSVTLTLTEK